MHFDKCACHHQLHDGAIYVRTLFLSIFLSNPMYVKKQLNAFINEFCVLRLSWLRRFFFYSREFPNRRIAENAINFYITHDASLNWIIFSLDKKISLKPSKNHSGCTNVNLFVDSSNNKHRKRISSKQEKKWHVTFNLFKYVNLDIFKQYMCRFGSPKRKQRYN